MEQVINEKNSRLYGLDVLKILSMIFITVIHAISYTGILGQSDILTFNRVFILILSSFTTISVNCFILITGYFQCDKKVNYKRIFALWFKVVAVSTFLTIIMLILRGGISFVNIIKSFFPVSTMHYWFLVCYLVLMISAPILNIVIEGVNKKQHFLLCVIGFIIFSIVFVSNPFIVATYYIGSARGIIWFYFLYLLAAYIKKYSVSVKSWKLILVCALCFALTFFLKYFNLSTVKNIVLLEPNSLISIVFTICVFLLFKSIKIKRNFMKKIISALSSCSFFVYIIQEHEEVRMWYWNLFSFTKYAFSLYFPLVLIASLLLLWPIAYLINFLLGFLKPLQEKSYNVLLKTCQKFDGFLDSKLNHEEEKEI